MRAFIVMIAGIGGFVLASNGLALLAGLLVGVAVSFAIVSLIHEAANRPRF